MSVRDRGVRTGQQPPGQVEIAVGVVRVADALYAHLVAIADGEQSRHLDEAFHSWTGDLMDLGLGRSARESRVDREAGERFGDASCGDELRAHLRHVAHLATSAQLEQLLRDELVELRRAQDAHWDGTRQQGVLVGELGGVVDRREAVCSDDRHDHDSRHAGLLAGLLQVVGRGGEQFRRGSLVWRGPGRHVNDGRYAVEGRRETLPGDPAVGGARSMFNDTRATTSSAAIKIFNGARVGTADPKPSVLDRIVGFAQRPEHPVGNGPQPRPRLLAALGQPLAIIHRGHLLSSPGVSATGANGSMAC